MNTMFIKDIGDSAEVAGKILLAKLHDRKPVPMTLDRERIVQVVHIDFDNDLGIIALGRDTRTKETIQVIMPYGATARASATIIQYTTPTPTEDANGPAS